MKEKDVLKRVNILIPESMYEEIVNNRNLKLSSTVREALEDSLAEHKITFTVSDETKSLYHKIYDCCDCSDADLEPFLRKGLRDYLDHEIKAKVSELEELRDRL
ncbi:MAG: hypothetical protein HRU09_19040 [Oligoflexales bacterium]|nr:hypothetical protein [Oligoflexales bacterium]